MQNQLLHTGESCFKWFSHWKLFFSQQVRELDLYQSYRERPSLGRKHFAEQPGEETNYGIAWYLCELRSIVVGITIQKSIYLANSKYLTELLNK